MYDAYPPGCCSVAAVLEQAGYAAVVANYEYDHTKKTILGNTNHLNAKGLIAQKAEYDKRLHDANDPVWREIRESIERHRPDVVVVSVFNVTMTAGIAIARMAKRFNPKVLTIFEGAFNVGLRSAINPADHGDFGVMDVAVRGEPELTILDVVERFAGGSRDFTGIAGASWRDAAGQVAHNEDRPSIEDLDSLPYPARHLIDGHEAMMPHAFQAIFGSRGCPFPCIFCCCHIGMGKRMRLRSAENIFNEIKAVHERYKTRYFFFCDDIFLMQKDRAMEVFRRIRDSGLPIFFTIQTRAEIVDDDALRLAKEAGCQHVAVGVEVGSPHVRELIKKGNRVEEVRRCAELVHKHGLRLNAFVLLGLPWERRADIEATVELVKDIEPYIVFPYMPSPTAGSELAAVVARKNPDGLAAFRDVCHIDPSADISQFMTPQEREAVLSWAIDELTQLNKRSLLLDILRRPRFYYALAQDFRLMRQPGALWSYVRDWLN